MRRNKIKVFKDVLLIFLEVLFFMDDRRKYNRVPLEDLAARLRYKDRAEEIDFCPVNVSEKGLAILTSQVIALESILILSLTDIEIEMKVIWSKTSEDGSGFYKSGLECLDSEVHLDNLIKDELSI